MYVFGVYLSIVDLLMIFSGFVVLILLYLAYEINKLKKLEIKLAIIESKMEREEKELERDISRLSAPKKREKKKGKYYCNKCKKYHFTTSKIGKNHRKFKR